MSLKGKNSDTSHIRTYTDDTREAPIWALSVLHGHRKDQAQIHDCFPSQMAGRQALQRTPTVAAGNRAGNSRSAKALHWPS